jgi:hypothetical protein
MYLTSSGNLAVDTNTLYVDAANNRVGIGTASPAGPLDVRAANAAQAVRVTSTTGTNPAYFGANNTGGSFYFGLDNSAGTEFGTAYAGAIYHSGAYPITFYTNATERMRLDASGNLGLGVTPSAWGSGISAFDLSSCGLAAAGIQSELTSNSVYTTSWLYKTTGFASRYVQNLNATGVHAWFTAASGTAGNAISFTQAMTLDASGNLGVGGTPSHILDVGANNSTPKTIALRYSTLPLYLSSTFDGTDGLNTLSINNNNTSNGSASWASAANSVYSSAAIQVTCNTSGGTVRFLTSAATNTAPTERARFTSGGYFKASNNGTYQSATDPYHEFNNTANGNPILRLANSNATGPYGVQIRFTGAAPDNNTEYFLNCADNAAGGTNRLFIYSDGDVLNHDGTYGTISDERLKRDIIDATSQWDDIKAIRFRKYRFKSDVEVKGEDAPYMLGVVAQELEQTSPGLVDEHPDFEQQEVTDEDGNVTTERVQVGTTKSVKSSILLMKAAVALQEAMARIEALEARLEALEA